MTQVDVDGEIYDSVKDLIEDLKPEYPSIKNFIDRTLKDKVAELKKK